MTSLARVEAFYDALLPALGLSRKFASHVGPGDAWIAADETHPATLLERSDDPKYPAIFFEDPAGTRLEICACRPAP